MTSQEVVEVLKDHFDHDTNYQMIRREDMPGFVLGNRIKVDLRNAKPNSHFAPFFKVNTIEDAKEIFLGVLPDDDVDLHFRLALNETDFDSTREIFFSLYKPDRMNPDDDQPFSYWY